MNSPNNKAGRSLDPLDRARQVSQALSEAARLARFSTRSKGNYSGGGFHARRGAALARILMTVSFFVGVALPSATAFVYYGLIASDQYVAEAKFLVNTNIIPQLDSIGALTGLAPVAVVQDTQIVANYVTSRAAVDAISQKIPLIDAYSASSIDYLSRFDKRKPIEKFLKYWEDMTSATIALPAGIVTLRVRAFDPVTAQKIANAVLAVSEALVNDMNNRMNNDAVHAAEVELERSTQRLTKARIALEKARNETGVLDASKAGDAINALLLETKSALLSMQQEYTTKAKLISPNTPQMRVLKSRIETTANQITDMEDQLTKRQQVVDDKLTIAASMSRFSELDLERQVAERLYSGAVASLEVARLASEQKLMYLNAFLRPALPQQAEYPKRLLYPALLTVVLIAVWGLFWGLTTLVRNHMA
jgi:capsular polysaccharide transport system permease protein